MSSIVPGLPSGAPPSSNGGLLAKSYTFLQQYIYRESGIVVEDGKQYLLETRLAPVMKTHRLANLDALAAALASRSVPNLSTDVIDAMTTNETLFFRDSVLFEAIRTQVLPDLLKNLRGKPLRIWSAAASSGQEAYSMAILALELGRNASDVEIVGTDLSTQILDRARKGRYGQFEVSRGLPTPLLMKYFTKAGLEWELKDEVKRMVKFTQFDLRRDFGFLGSFHLILCRNVLIYFDPPTKTKILERMGSQLAHGGLLTLGCAEIISNLTNAFQRKLIGQSAFYSKAGE